MKERLFYLLGLPLVWLLVAVFSFQPGVDRIYLLAVAPSAWLFMFVDPLKVTMLQLQTAAFPLMFIVGLVLLKLKIRPRETIISTFFLTFVLWLVLVIAVSKGTAIRNPNASFLWFFCCFNFSLCLLPFFALPIKIIIWLKNRYIGSVKKTTVPRPDENNSNKFEMYQIKHRFLQAGPSSDMFGRF